MPPALHFAVHPEHRLSTKSGPRAGPPLQPGESPAAPLGPTLITDRVFTLTLVGDGAPLAPTSHLCRRVASCSALCRAPRTPSFHQVGAPCRAPTAAGREPRSPPRPHFNNGPGLHANARGGRSAAGPHEPPLPTSASCSALCRAPRTPSFHQVVAPCRAPTAAGREPRSPPRPHFNNGPGLHANARGGRSAAGPHEPPLPTVASCSALCRAPRTPSFHQVVAPCRAPTAAGREPRSPPRPHFNNGPGLHANARGGRSAAGPHEPPLPTVASCSALCRAPRTPSFHQVVAPCRAPTAAGREPRSPPRPHFNNGPGLHANARGGRSAAGPHEPPLRRVPPALHFAVHPEHRLSTKSGPRAGPPLQPGESPAAPLGPTLITDRVFTLTLVGDGAPLAPTSHLSDECLLLCTLPCTQNTVFPPSRGPVPGPHCSRARAPQPPSAPL